MPRVKQCRKVGCHRLATQGRAYCNEHQELEEAQRNRHDRYLTRRYNKYERNRNDVKQKQTSFYKTKQWVELRKAVLSRDNYLCQYCQVQGRVTPAKVVDHIVPVEYNLKKKSDVANLAVICGRCHSKKTAWEQNYYGTGKNNKLKNVPQINSINTLAKMINNY